VRRGYEFAGIGQRAELGPDVAVVADVVSAVGQWRGIPRAHPDGIDAQVSQIGKPIDDPTDVTRTVAIVVGERSGIDLRCPGCCRCR
jgi:hypothetical protein